MSTGPLLKGVVKGVRASTLVVATRVALQSDKPFVFHDSDLDEGGCRCGLGRNPNKNGWTPELVSLTVGRALREGCAPCMRCWP